MTLKELRDSLNWLPAECDTYDVIFPDCLPVLDIVVVPETSSVVITDAPLDDARQRDEAERCV